MTYTPWTGWAFTFGVGWALGLLGRLVRPVLPALLGRLLRLVRRRGGRRRRRLGGLGPGRLGRDDRQHLPPVGHGEHGLALLRRLQRLDRQRLARPESARPTTRAPATIAAGQRGAVGNVYTGNYAYGGRGVAHNTGSGNVVGGSRVTVGNADSGREVTAGRVGGYNPATGKAGSAGWVRGDQGGVARVGDDFYGAKDGNVYQRNGQGDWSQVERRQVAGRAGPLAHPATRPPVQGALDRRPALLRPADVARRRRWPPPLSRPGSPRGDRDDGGSARPMPSCFIRLWSVAGWIPSTAAAPRAGPAVAVAARQPIDQVTRLAQRSVVPRRPNTLAKMGSITEARSPIRRPAGRAPDRWLRLPNRRGRHRSRLRAVRRAAGEHVRLRRRFHRLELARPTGWRIAFMHVFFESKSWTLFSMLFGFGLRAAARARPRRGIRRPPHLPSAAGRALRPGCRSRAALRRRHPDALCGARARAPPGAPSVHARPPAPRRRAHAGLSRWPTSPGHANARCRATRDRAGAGPARARAALGRVRRRFAGRGRGRQRRARSPRIRSRISTRRSPASRCSPCFSSALASVDPGSCATSRATRQPSRSVRTWGLGIGLGAMAVEQFLAATAGYEVFRAQRARAGRPTRRRSALRLRDHGARPGLCGDPDPRRADSAAAGLSSRRWPPSAAWR